MIEIEKNIIGSILIDNLKYDIVSDKISASDFHDKRNSTIYRIITELKGKVNTTLLTTIAREKYKENIASYLAEVMDISDGRNIEECAKKLRETSIRKRTREIGDRVKNHDTKEDLQEIIHNAQKELVELIDNTDETFKEPKQLAIDLLAYICEMKERGSNISGLSTGFPMLDTIIDGLKQGELIIIAARPSIGKTSMMMSMVNQISVMQKKISAVFSLESTWKTMAIKCLSILSRIPARKIEHGDIWGDDEKAVQMYNDMIYESGIYLFDKTGLNINEIRSHLNRLIKKGKKPDVVFIDYLTLIATDKGNDQNNVKVGRLTKALAKISKEMMIPVVLLAQINRANCEDMPRLMDLSASGEIEADADVVIILHRPEFYKKEKTPDSEKGKIIVGVAKNRNGPVENLLYNFEGRCTRIYE